MISKRLQNKNCAYHTIYFDMDGVLVDFLGGACKYLGIDTLDPINRKMLKDELPFEKHFVEGGRDTFIDIINEAGYDFWMELELLPWANTLFNLVNKISGKYNVYFLTSHSDFPVAVQAKINYIKKYFNSDRIVITKYKSLCARPGTILIDDMDYNLSPFESEGGDSFKWPNQWKLLDGEIDINEYLKLIDEKLRIKD